MGKTLFMMIKSHQYYDIQMAIKAGVWSSTSHGNKVLEAAYEEYVNKRKGNIYLFFSVNKSGHICAFGELMSKKLDSVPDIWLEKQKYSGCFIIRFLQVKNVPMNNFADLHNSEGMPMKRCRDTDVIEYEEGMIMTRTIFDSVIVSSLLLDKNFVDFKTCELPDPKQTLISPSQGNQDSTRIKNEESKNNYLTPECSDQTFITPTKHQSKEEEKGCKYSTKKMRGELSSSSPAFSPTEKSRSNEKDGESECSSTEKLQQMFKTFRKSDITGSGNKGNNITKLLGKTVFSYGYYSNQDFLGIYNY